MQKSGKDAFNKNEKENVINNRLNNSKTIFSKLFSSFFPIEKNNKIVMNETFKNISKNSFAKSNILYNQFPSYPETWKKVITEKYYQNNIYKIILSSDLKNFLKREPLTQQLTSVQEKELDFLRIKMCHYFDTLRFYFRMKEKIKPNSNSTRKLIYSNLSPSSQKKGVKKKKVQNNKKSYVRKLNSEMYSSLNPVSLST